MSADSPRALVAYATAGSEGQTERLAARLAETLRGDGARVDVVDCAAPPAGLRLGAYDGVLVGGSVRGGRYRRSLRCFLRAGDDELARIPWAFSSVCLTVAATREDSRAAARELPRRFLRGLRLEPREVAVFGGALRFSRHGPLGGACSSRSTAATSPRPRWSTTGSTRTGTRWTRSPAGSARRSRGMRTPRRTARATGRRRG